MSLCEPVRVMMIIKTKVVAIVCMYVKQIQHPRILEEIVHCVNPVLFDCSLQTSLVLEGQKKLKIVDL